MIELDIIEYRSFNLKSQLTMLAEDGRLIALVRITHSDCSLHLIYNFYMLLIYDSEKNKIMALKPIDVEFWNKTYEIFYMKS